MHERKIVTFDLDGVIFPLVPYICDMCGIDKTKQTDHNIFKCDLFTKDEQDTIVSYFGTREIYEKCGTYDGSKKLKDIAEIADVYINSWCIGDDRDIKKEIIHSLAPNIPEKNMMFGAPFTKKEFIHSDYIVEDNLDNVLANLDSAKYFILINTPYNQGDLPDKVIRVNDLNECMDILLKEL